MKTLLIHRLCSVLMTYVSELAEDGAQSDELFDLVMDGIQELKIKAIDARHNVHHANKSSPPKHPDKEISNDCTLVLNPIPARRIGRPPSQRKESKVDQVVRKMRGEKQRKSVKSCGSQKGRRKKVNQNIFFINNLVLI